MENRSAATAGDPGLALASEAINRLLWLDPDTLERLGELDGRVICLQLGEATSPALTLYVLPSAAGLRLHSRIDGTPDVTITGELSSFTRLLFGARPNQPVREGALHIRGDIELGQRFQRILERIDIDWEEQASRVVGDVAAHRLGNAVRDLRSWVIEAGDTLLTDAREYLQEEARVLARREQVERFLRAVDDLRTDVDRLESRLARLAGKG